MRLPPAIIHIRRVADGRRKLRLWLPVFLLWPVAALLAMAAAPALLALAILFPLSPTVRRFFAGLFAATLFCCELRGLAVSIEEETKTIDIHVT